MTKTFAPLIVLLGITSVQLHAQEVVSSQSVKIQHIKGCITLTYPDKPTPSKYTDEHKYSTVKRGGGLIGGVNYVTNQMTKSRSGKNYSKAQLQKVGYKSTGKKGNVESFSRDFQITRTASIKLCVKPHIDLSGLNITAEARAKPVEVKVKSNPGKPASQMISAKTAAKINADNRKFKQQVEAALKATLKQINATKFKMSPQELGKLWSKEGIQKAIPFKFFKAEKSVTVKLRKVEKK